MMIDSCSRNDQFSDLLTADGGFDLSYRPTEGSQSYYELDIVYRTLDARGLPVQCNNYRGVFRREVLAVTTDGVREQIEWRNVAWRTSGEPIDDPQVRRPKYGNWSDLKWASSLKYEFCNEQDYDDFPKRFDGFPVDSGEALHSWNVYLLMIDAHAEFDFLRSRRHGAIHKLTRLGATQLTPDSNKAFRLGLPPIIEVPAFHRGDYRLGFSGLTLVNGVPCAELSFSMDFSPFEMISVLGKTGHASWFGGTINVALGDGSVEEGAFVEFVFGNGACVSPVYRIKSVDESRWV